MPAEPDAHADAEREARSCRRCGAAATAPVGGLPDGWSLEADRGGTRFLCPSCTRSNLRAIEGRLDGEWWEG